MSTHSEHADPSGASGGAVRALAAFLACASMLLSSISLFSGGAVSDPVVVNNPEDTHTILWEFDEPGDYILSGVELSGGDALLGFMNLTEGDHDIEDFSEGTVMNLDLESIPGSVIIGEPNPDETFESQPGPEGVDAYISENRPTDQYGTSPNLLLDSESGKLIEILLWFDVSSVPSLATISEATLWLYQQSGSKGDDVVLDIHHLSEPFAEAETTWLESQTGTLWDEPGGDYDNHSYGTYTINNAAGYVAFDLTELVELWTDGTLENYGLIMVPEVAVGDNQKAFQSSDDVTPVGQNPRLVVNYSMHGNSGLLQSRVIGPGTNATFTLASFNASAVSRLDDDFSGTAALPDWTWTNEPTAYDINVTRPDWLHVTGSPSTQIQNATVTCDFMHQNVSGDFSASTCLEDGFSEDTMGAGLLLYESDSEWMYIAKAKHTTNSRIQVVICQGGASALAAELVWTEGAVAHLRIDRNSTGVWFYASGDGASYQLAYHHAGGAASADDLVIGLFIYSGSSTSPVADFDHFTVAYTEDPELEVMVRFGNSTSLSDDSWEDWLSAQELSGPEALYVTSQYIQYQVSMSSPEGWYTPVFSGFDCWYELYAQSGMIETYEHVPVDFSMWLGMTTDETVSDGSVLYTYSTDGGSTWVTAGDGGSYSITSDQPSFKVRVSVHTYDTLDSPRVHSVSATHVTALSRLDIVVPEVVVAGEAFTVTVTAKDSSNFTMDHWTGQLSLQAFGLDYVTPLDPDLEVTSAWIREYGSVTVLDEAYTKASTIVVKVSSEDMYGFSAPITVLPGPISSLYITPTVDTMLEGAQQVFSGVARDEFGNALDIEHSWTVDEGVGTLNATNGTSVIFTAGEAGSSGYLRVSAGGLTASLLITITHTANAPEFLDDIPDQTEYEDAGSWTIDLGPYVEDPVHEDSQLRWFVTGEAVIDVSGENRTGNLIVTLSTKKDQSGTDTLDLYIVDPDGLWSVQTFLVRIIPVNDWPVISLVDPLVVRYDVLYIYNMKYYIQDADNAEDDLSLWVDDGSSPYVTVQDLALHMLYPASLNGTDQTVIVTVSDGSANASTVISVTVSDNYAPVLSDSIPGVDIYQGEVMLDVFDLDEYFADPDGDELDFTYWYSHVLVNISADHEVSFFAPTDWYGSEYVIFTATDERGARVESAATVLVHRVNQAPVIDGVPDLVVKHDLEYQFDLTWYVSDPDDDIDGLDVTTDDMHVVPSGLMLLMEYPESLLGAVVHVTVTVSDGELYDSCMIDITVGNNTPPTAGTLPMHSFQEDLPVPYPPEGGLDAYFGDEEGGPLTFEAFSLTDGVSASAATDSQGEWTVRFSPQANWNGYAWFVVRGTDPGGAIVETVAELTILSVPDAPVLAFNETIEVQTGIQKAVDLYAWAVDPDRHDQGLDFAVSSAYASYATVIEGVLVLEFPDEFLSDGEERRAIQISVSVSDPDGLHDTDYLSVVVVGTLDPGGGSWAIVGMLAMAAVAAASFVAALTLRKRPFVIKDIMVIHNDGFLIGRAAAKTEGEIDEDVLSGMLTAVLNFVEDSMAKTQDGLRSFGFENYNALVKRGKTTYMAVVYEGDAPEAIEDRLGEFLAKVEKIYRKRIENWTGDMDTDFAGIEVLLQAFVKENSKKGNGLNGSLARSNGKGDGKSG